MSKGMINIGGDVNDINYRYKMPPLTIKIEGRGNGIKTILTNVMTVCKHLHTQPDWCTKFFGIEVGALSKYDTKRDVGIVHGVHQAGDLQQHLKKFVRGFILCPKCHLPELQVKVHQKKSLLLGRCMSCGWKGSNPSSHKVKTYMINHPAPSKKKGATSQPTSEAIPQKRRVKGKSSKAKPPKEEKKEESGLGNLGGDNDDVWSVDVSEDAVAKRKAEEMRTLARKKQKDRKEREERKVDGPAGILRLFVTETDDDNPRPVEEILDEIKRLSLAHNLDLDKKMKIIFDALCAFDDDTVFSQSLAKHSTLWQAMLEGKEESQVFFGCLEEILVRRNADALLPKAFKILEALYDAEIATEEQIIEWYDTPTDKARHVQKDEAEAVRSKAKVFVEWLQQEDSSDEEESGEENDE